jgi:hypothetical protein
MEVNTSATDSTLGNSTRTPEASTRSMTARFKGPWTPTRASGLRVMMASKDGLTMPPTLGRRVASSG